ncbi:MAG: ribonuclease R [Muribaculaceae bacterium]|nr:ribonuclease R [Muribaculaceae bacterium]MDY6411917.1 ribonuclease R [Bacteroidales bacterium]
MAKRDRLNSLNIERREFHDKVINFFNTQDEAPFNYKQVSAQVGAKTPKQRALIVEILEQLSVDGFINEIAPGKFRAAQRNNVAAGIFVRRSNGKNSVILEGDDSAPIMVAERNSMHALNGDKVMVHISAARSGFEPEAEVIKIVERKEQVFIGTLDIRKYFAHLATDSKFLATDIFIPLDKLAGGKTGDKVVVRIIEWPEGSNSPIGEVIDVLGKAGENNAEIHAILAEFGLPYRYPESVERVANKLEPGITAEEIARRRDMRGVTTFTIDPADAKDFDDALSIEKLPNGRWEIGVHIADVTHYVKPGSVIDKEAYERATSVYLVDRTVPMLPERLCNYICSLRPGEDKLCHSVVFEMDDNAKVYKYKICHTVINSDRRFCYEEAQEIIEKGEGELAQEILTFHALAQKLRKQRFEEGAVEFNREEKYFDIDETGTPTAVHLHVSREANQLIEEFMLLANRTVAAHIGKVPASKKAKAFVYRIHEEPDSEKLSNVAHIALHFGHKLKTSGTAKEVNRSINKLLKEIKGKPEEELISLLAIKAQAKAVYSTENVGHYGLAFEYYTHFTSPIRRYPDVMVHRLLDKYAQKGARTVNPEKLEEECKHVSSQEQLAANAERASIKYKEVEFMGARLGEVYDGKISGVTEWGVYVELNETHCEGMIAVRDLDDDFYEFDEKNYLIYGRRRGKKYQLGDPVTIQVARADLVKKQLDFVLVDRDNPAGSHRIDKAPITYESRMSRESATDKMRAQYEGGSASRRSKRGQRGNSTRREVTRGRSAKNGRGKNPKSRRRR